MELGEGEDRRAGDDSQLDLDALVALAAHEGATLVLPRGGQVGLGLRISYRAVRLIAEHMLFTGGVGLRDVLRFWARRAADGRPSLVFVVARPVPAESVVINLKGEEVTVRREDEVGEERSC